MRWGGGAEQEGALEGPQSTLGHPPSCFTGRNLLPDATQPGPALPTQLSQDTTSFTKASLATTKTKSSVWDQRENTPARPGSSRERCPGGLYSALGLGGREGQRRGTWGGACSPARLCPSLPGPEPAPLPEAVGQPLCPRGERGRGQQSPKTEASQSQAPHRAPWATSCRDSGSTRARGTSSVLLAARVPDGHAGDPSPEGKSIVAPEWDGREDRCQDCSAGRAGPAPICGRCHPGPGEETDTTLGTHSQLVEEKEEGEEEEEAVARARILKFDYDNHPNELDSPTAGDPPFLEPEASLPEGDPAAPRGDLAHFLTTEAFLGCDIGC